MLLASNILFSETATLFVCSLDLNWSAIVGDHNSLQKFLCVVIVNQKLEFVWLSRKNAQRRIILLSLSHLIRVYILLAKTVNSNESYAFNVVILKLKT